MDEVQNVIKCVQLYCKWTRQVFNLDKSGCFFSHNVIGKNKTLIKSYLGLKELDKKLNILGSCFLGEEVRRSPLKT